MSLRNLLLKLCTLEHVKSFWKKYQDEEIERILDLKKLKVGDSIGIFYCRFFSSIICNAMINS